MTRAPGRMAAGNGRLGEIPTRGAASVVPTVTPPTSSIPPRGEARPVLLVTVRPGPVLHVWRDGQEVAAVPLDMHAALALVERLLREVQATCR